MRLIRETRPVARKSHLCDACSIIDRAGYSLEDYEPDDRPTIMRLAEAKGRITKGMKYIKIVYEDDGIQTFRARLDADNVCRLYDFYED